MSDKLKNKTRAKINAALSQISEIENQLRLLRRTLEPLAYKQVKTPLRSADGKIDYTKTSVLFME